MVPSPTDAGFIDAGQCIVIQTSNGSQVLIVGKYSLFTSGSYGTTPLEKCPFIFGSQASPAPHIIIGSLTSNCALATNAMATNKSTDKIFFIF